ncbi:MAG: ferritin-like domain-containing protein [Myxococcaceae bacterium]
MTTELHQLAGEAWAFRARVELDAALRFTRLAAAIAEFDPDSPAIPLMLRAAEDEQRHAVLCAELSATYGVVVEAIPAVPADVAPVGLARRQAVLYEVVAACCITETESVATLATLLAEQAEPNVRSVLHEIARDEVIHGRMGWAHLAREAASVDVAFLSLWIPVMLAGTVDDSLFGDAEAAAQEDGGLLRYGVLPHSRKRDVFARTLLDVVFPGLETFGVDAGPARAWLAARLNAKGTALAARSPGVS